MMISLIFYISIYIITVDARKNVLLVISDDLSTDFQGPNMRFLAERGVNFTNATTVYPVCGPARAAFLTGRYADDTKDYTFVQQVNNFWTIPKWLKDKLGYSTASFGKVFHNGGMVDGVDLYKNHWSESNLHGTAMAYDEGANSECDRGFIMCDIAEKQSADYKVATSAIGYIRKLNQLSKPWFIAVGFHRPHLNLAVADKYLERGKPPLQNQTLLTPVTSLNYFECDDLRVKMTYFPKGPELIVSRQEKRPTTLVFTKNYPEQVGGILRYYKGAVMQMDAQLGRLIKALKDIGEFNNTLIIFTSDHGFNCGRNGMWCKNSLFDGATRIPLIISGPGFKQGSVENSPVSSIDVFPTILSYIGGGVDFSSLKLPGKSLLKLPVNSNYRSFSQYPRCQIQGVLQTDACMFRVNDICNTLPLIKFMGYTVKQTFEKDLFTLVIWKPFHDARLGCGLIAPGTLSKFPLIDRANARTIWDKPWSYYLK